MKALFFMVVGAIIVVLGILWVLRKFLGECFKKWIN